MLVAPVSLSAVRSGSGQRTVQHNPSASSNPGPVATHDDSELDPESLAQLLKPDSVCKIITVYQVACHNASTKPHPPSQINYELEAVTLLVEVVLDNFKHLCEESHHIVEEYIDWDPAQS
ncbi:hypothetical protein H1R20_g7879, partial [Candolleomyces eurysporus]